MGAKVFKAPALKAGALAVGLASAAAQAQPTAASDEEEIIVTAQKREQVIQDTPLAISAFGEEALEDLQVQDVADLASVAPGLQGDAVSAGQPLLNIRGIGSNDFSIGNDPALGIFIDEVYAGRSAGALTNLYDINRVEVVRGPQGTLFGRNTTAGAISIIRNRPSNVLEAGLSASYGSYDDIIGEGMISGPLSESVAARVAAFYRSRDGFHRRLQDGDDLGEIDSLSGRTALLFRPSANLSLDVSADYQRDRNASAIYQSRSFNGPFTNLRFYDTTTNLAEEQLRTDRDVFVASARATLDLGNYTLTSITAYRTYQFDYLEDTDGGPANILAFGVDESQDAYSQEMRLNYGSGRVDWFVGASYFREDLRQTATANYDEEAICGAIGRVNVGITIPCGPLLNLLSGGLIPPTFEGLPSVTDINTARARYQSWGLYGDLTWRATNRLRFIVGARYSSDRKRVIVNNPPPPALVAPILLGSPTVFLEATAGPVRLRDSWDNFAPRAVVQYDLTRSLMAYASISRGYKSGGFNLLVPSGGAFDPELITSYETGLKGAFDRFTFDLAGFYYTYKNLQVQIVEAFPITENAASASGYGLEASFRARLIDRFHLAGSATLLNAEYDRYSPAPGVDFSGNRLARAPRFAGALQAEYSIPLGAAGSLEAGINVQHQSDVFHSPENDRVEFAPGYTLTDVRVTWAPNQRWSVTGFVNNLFDVEYITQTQQITALGVDIYSSGEPRTFGVRVRAGF